MSSRGERRLENHDLGFTVLPTVPIVGPLGGASHDATLTSRPADSPMVPASNPLQSRLIGPPSRAEPVSVVLFVFTVGLLNLGLGFLLAVALTAAPPPRVTPPPPARPAPGPDGAPPRPPPPAKPPRLKAGRVPPPLARNARRR